MAAASLDVNFKEELSAIEQCNAFRHLLPSTVADSPMQGSKFSRKQSAQPLFTVFSNIPLKFKFGSSSPSSNRWQGPIP